MELTKTRIPKGYEKVKCKFRREFRFSYHALLLGFSEKVSPIKFNSVIEKLYKKFKQDPLKQIDFMNMVAKGHSFVAIEGFCHEFT